MKVSAGELMAAAAAAAAVSPEINQLSANMHLHKYNLEPEGLVPSREEGTKFADVVNSCIAPSSSHISFNFQTIQLQARDDVLTV